jgi:hypothetical protein
MERVSRPGDFRILDFFFAFVFAFVFTFAFAFAFFVTTELVSVKACDEHQASGQEDMIGASGNAAFCTSTMNDCELGSVFGF